MEILTVESQNDGPTAITTDFTGGNRTKLTRLVDFYAKSVVNKPNYIKDYEFKNNIIKPIPQRIVKPYPIPFKMLDEAKAKVDEMVKLGVLEKVESNAYTHPGFFGKKPTGKLRLLYNATYLNDYLERSATYFPTIDELLYSVGEGKILTAIDCTGGYNQVMTE